MTNPNWQPVGRDRSQCLGPFADLFLCCTCLVQVEAGLGSQLCSSQAHIGSAEAAITVDHVVALNSLPRASHRQYLTLACTRVLPKRPQKKHIQWTASNTIRAGPEKLHKQHIQRHILVSNRICWGEFRFVWPAHAQHVIHGIQDGASQSASLRVDPTYERPKAIKT